MTEKTNSNFKPDLATKVFMERPDIFADAINYAIYHGRQVVKAESLEDASTVATSFVYNGNNAAVTFEKIRDVRKVVKLSPDDQTAYMIYGAENQSHIHYAMPVKTMLYDVMEYADQIDTMRKKIKAKEYDENGNRIPKGKISSDEFLSSWRKDDKLIPVVSVVVNFSDHKWDGPLSLHEMFAQDVPFDKEPSERYNVIKEMIPDYRIILIDPHQMSDEELDSLKSNLGTVLSFIKNSDNKNRIRKRFADTELDAESVMVINSCTGSNIALPQKGEKIKMCKAWEDFKKEGIEEGRAEGRAENQNEMIAALRANGVSEQLIQATLKTMKENAKTKAEN